ncbi:PREDICTED: uncharacterized protein LOC109583608 [Amphimedon queenslandica]|uniref:Uncharacterized protein n=1 Tax=Amphimedon queenslandica TaxID=400682 RepID=A0AAN0JCW7_AMPQE|nr:PREDICTED: uncharacterized protein LOC109583608 [Amphimedon queenslandica]|eukprot:XP_019854591.1 PREDICTED: uncharacterized protein LOC109583608 [Amphimedon queenslandica]
MVLLIILIFVLIIIIIQRKRSKDIHPRTTERVRQELPLTNINNDDTIGSLHTNFEYLAATETGRAPPTITHHYSTISDNVYVQTSTDNNKVSDASQHCYSSVHTNTQNENTTTISGDSAIPTEEYNKLNHDENSRDTTLPRGMDIYSSLELSQESSYNHIERTSGPKGPHMEHQNGYSTLRKQEQS